MLAARLCAAPLPRCGASSPGPKFAGESKVRWSPVIPTWHSCSARQFSPLSLSAPWTPNSLDLHPWSPHSLDLHPWSPNSLVLHPLLAAPFLREIAAYLVSGRPSAAATAYICGELFNSSQDSKDNSKDSQRILRKVSKDNSKDSQRILRNDSKDSQRTLRNKSKDNLKGSPGIPRNNSKDNSKDSPWIIRNSYTDTIR